MTKYVSAGMFLIAFAFTLIMQSCGPQAPKVNPWDRIQTTNSFSVVSVVTVDHLIQYSKIEEGRGKKKKISYVKVADDEKRMSFGEMGKLGKGMSKGLKGYQDAAKDFEEGRDNAEIQNMVNLETHIDNLPANVESVMKQCGFEVMPFQNVFRLRDIRANNNKTKAILAKAKSDAILSLTGNVGYVKESKKMKGLGGLIKVDIGNVTNEATYTLIAEYNVNVRDKSGYIGSRGWLIETGISKVSKEGVPAFTEDDFKIIDTKLNEKLLTLLEKI